MKSFLELKENDTLVAEAEAEAETETETETETKAGADDRSKAGTRDAEAGDGIGAYAYTPAYGPPPPPALIALDVLRAMDSLQLLQDQASPQNRGEWIDENKMRAALFVYGELAWTVGRPPRSKTFGKPVWNSQNVEFGPITLPDLFQWKSLNANNDPFPPGGGTAARPFRSPMPNC